jgi:HK97 family phage prohead protease
MQRKTYTAEAKIINETEGIVEAFVNSMGKVDLDEEVIDVKAFNKSIEDGGISVAWFHNQAEPVGKVISASAISEDTDERTGMDSGKLKAVMQFNLETQRGKEAFSDVKFGAVRQWSVGFRATDHEIKDLADGGKYRVISDLDWVEVSPVMRGASPETQTVGVKTDADTEEDSVSDSEEIKTLKTIIELEKLRMELNNNG